MFPHGSTDSLPFATMGSGSLNAMSVFESGYKDDMTQEEAEKLVARAIRYGVPLFACIHQRDFDACEALHCVQGHVAQSLLVELWEMAMVYEW